MSTTSDTANRLLGTPIMRLNDSVGRRWRALHRGWRIAAALAGVVFLYTLPLWDPPLLHTPLMSGANFIHGIVIVGAILVLGGAEDTFTKAVGFAALVLATANVVGGWFVTDRMLGMFKRRPDPKKEGDS